MATVTITIRTTALGGVAVEVSPKLEVLNAAAGGTALTVAETYALGALNFLREHQDSIALLERPKKIKRTFREGQPVDRVTIRLEDRATGGASCVSTPSFDQMAGLVAGGTEVSLAQKTALLALGRILKMGREARKPS